MFSIRSFSPTGIVTNKILGNSYQVYQHHKCDKNVFNEVFKDVFGEDFDKDKHLTRCIIIGQDGLKECLHVNQERYIVNATGSTYEKISVPKLLNE